MVDLHAHPLSRAIARTLLMLVSGVMWVPQLSAADYYLTIAGGYDRSGNQASLEANVLFYQQILVDRHQTPAQHEIYFADGHDPTPDVQILAEKPAKSVTPATDLIAALHRRRGEAEVTYRDHRVANITGPLDPARIRRSLEALAKTARAGDRLIIYVTAHGSEGAKDDSHNTTIDCWNERKITAREFSGWLDKIPSDVPVVMVMAQCYCGGFGHTLFQGLDEKKELTPQLRAGFFAQRHDLPAAGCRPDIEHDEEFSSYFWGAIAGHSRNGVAIETSDLDSNGVVSFAEAFAHAVAVGETIDIPLRTSDVFLRRFSQLTEKSKEPVPDSEAKKENSDKSGTAEKAESTPTDDKVKTAPLATMSGTLQSFVDRSRPVSCHIVTQLSKTLGFELNDDVKSVLTAYEDHRRAGRFAGRNRSRRQSSGRRELLAEVAEKWPELGDERRWKESPLLKADNQDKLLAEVKQLPAWKNYEERSAQMKTAGDAADQHELRSVKFRRLIQTLESIVLEQNLPHVARQEIVTRYQQLIALEETTLGSSSQHKK